LAAAFLTAGLAAFFTAGRLAVFLAAGLAAVFAFGSEAAVVSAVAIIQSPISTVGVLKIACAIIHK
jgi:hypothetical protein